MTLKESAEEEEQKHHITEANGSSGKHTTELFLRLWLHAYKYVHKDMVFKTAPPYWAVPFLKKNAKKILK